MCVLVLIFPGCFGKDNWVLLIHNLHRIKDKGQFFIAFLDPLIPQASVY